MSAFEHRAQWRNFILIPADFVWIDEDTLLAHQGAALLRDEGDRGRVVGYTKLCTDVLRVDWKEKPADAAVVVSCFGCLGACEQ